MTGLYEKLSEAEQLVNEINLIDAGLVTEEILTQGTERHKMLDLTEQGRDYVNNEFDREIKHRGRGEIVHRYWQHQIRDAFDLAGRTAKVELFDADVYVLMDDKELAVEVAMRANDREVKHAKQRLERDLDEVWVVCPDEAVSNEIEQRMEEEGLLMDQIAFRLFRDFSDTEIFE